MKAASVCRWQYADVAKPMHKVAAGILYAWVFCPISRRKKRIDFALIKWLLKWDRVLWKNEGKLIWGRVRLNGDTGGWLIQLVNSISKALSEPGEKKGVKFFIILAFWMCFGSFVFHVLELPSIQEFLFCATWDFVACDEKESVVIKTSSPLQGGFAIMQSTLELKYKGKIVYIVEVRDVYNKNTAHLKRTSEKNADTEEISKSAFHFILEREQADKFEKLAEMLEEYLVKTLDSVLQDDFIVGELEINRKEIVEISYQPQNANKPKDMYIEIFNGMERKISKEEAELRRGRSVISLDEFRFEESIFTNEDFNRIREGFLDNL